MAPTAIAKKAKGKKHADPNETSKLLAAKISQLEQDAAGEKDQEAEIGTFIICRILVYCIVFFLSLLRLRSESNPTGLLCPYNIQSARSRRLLET